VLGGIRDLGSDTIIAYRFPWIVVPATQRMVTRKELLPDFAMTWRISSRESRLTVHAHFQPQFGVGTSDVRHGSNRAKNVILQGIRLPSRKSLI